MSKLLGWVGKFFKSPTNSFLAGTFVGDYIDISLREDSANKGGGEMPNLPNWVWLVGGGLILVLLVKK